MKYQNSISVLNGEFIMQEGYNDCIRYCFEENGLLESSIRYVDLIDRLGNILWFANEFEWGIRGEGL